MTARDGQLGLCRPPAGQFRHRFERIMMNFALPTRKFRALRRGLQLCVTAIVAFSLWLVSVPPLAQTETAAPENPVIVTNLGNTASATYSTPTGNPIQGRSRDARAIANLVDPFGQVLGCDGESLPSTSGFSVALFNTAPGNPNLAGGLVSLTPTEDPAPPDNLNLPEGFAPNVLNANPQPTQAFNEGRFNFLLDPDRGQLDPGSSYILRVTPPASSPLDRREIRIEIGALTDDGLYPFTATALDGLPIRADSATTQSSFVASTDITSTSLVVTFADLDISVCDREPIRITKTGDRASASPGDIVIYRIEVENTLLTSLDSLVVSDALPAGFNLIDESVRAKAAGEAVELGIARGSDRTVSFTLPAPLPTGEFLEIAYAVEVNPDALRGSGENSASVSALRSDNRQPVSAGPAIYRIRIRGGLLSDEGTILGRVFVDRNFDGEQQPGEPGVPNAVIFLDGGTRITTDPDGLFSVTNVLPGNRTGVIDLTSLPGYTLAPNRRFIERNSQSRLVRLAPGSTVRMNFAVTPTFNAEVQP
ncbi:DUF11 domain-containing protein [Synechococcus sp. PCC 7336]|uniref:DUF11 domain-containing protein n=1 Tax=Synechococcus sp. PCC 7336 TaxID=195250 RepID=UPI000367ED5E|nr:DUF11 domain-containing protein [Synechococcus sp. PCC 7336]